MDIDFLPSHLVIMGGSYIGLEFAQAFRRFGSEVTVIELGPRLISREDDDVSQVLPASSRRRASTCASIARSLALRKKETRSR